MDTNYNKVFIVAECGINHNGSVDLAKQLIDGAKFSGANAVKFQKRDLNSVYTQEELDKPRESPWGTTNRAQKQGLEFNEEQYDIIDAYCKQKDIEWFASPWDVKSADFLTRYDLKYNKVASALLTHEPLMEAIAKQGKYTFISTGMSSIREIGNVVNIFMKHECPFELMHCNSEYPLSHTKANLRCIDTLRATFNHKVGYSCHTPDIITPCAAVAMGATSIEKHITLSRAMYGSDQSASVEIMGFYKMCDYIRSIEAAFGEGNKIVTDAENKCKAKLRRNNDYKV